MAEFVSGFVCAVLLMVAATAILGVFGILYLKALFRGAKPSGRGPT